MRFVLSALLYLSVVTSANALDIPALEALREGEMKKLNFHSEPQPVSDAAFYLPDETEHFLSNYEGKFVLLNFWATWCAPCRHEMPMLSELQSEFGGDDFAVVTIATGRNKIAGMTKFFNEIGVDNLPYYRDPRQRVARDMAVLGLPITVIINREGQEIARMQGDADWASDSAKAIISTLRQPAEIN
ncbi:TlpA family protein disulfide reductase [Shimia ponticola]|uniref:TlpA family protein disulfide reductase n=1 Tax=Shimia ponticola TaxID=2582893 RepID=UPI0011BD4DA1|nr:TlpA disulfide reductase family protein [Shimia ponticola]